MESTLDLSSFVIQPYRRKYLRGYFQRMSQDNLNELWDDNVASVLEEQGFNIVSNPRSVYRVEKLYAALAKYAPKTAPYVDMRDVDIKEGVRLARACFARPKDRGILDLPAFTPELVYAITSNRKGSAGLTAWGQTKAESYVRAYERGVQQMRGDKRPDPCVAFKRTQFDDKTRLVWGYPYAMTAQEGIFARPLIERFKEGNTPMAFGMSTGVLGARLRVASYHKEWAYSTDVSSFDASIPAQLISVAFHILSSWFDMDKVEPTTGVRYGDIWDQIVHYFIHTPIVMPNGNIYKGKRHGIPSGSYFTQMIDSVVNVIIVGAISSHFKLHVNQDDIFVLGDDVLFWSNRRVELDHISDFSTRLMGMRFNAHKSHQYHWDEDILYLGRVWHKGVPSLDDEGIITRMTQPETYRKYSKDEEERAREVRMLFLSYAAVYRDAYRIYIRCVGVPIRWHQTNVSIENWVYNGWHSQGTYGYEQNPDMLSGLQRYLLKYVASENKLSGVSTPLALQFWK